MTNGWTGGQYSLFRMIFGTYLCVHFVHLIGWGAELFSNAGALADGAASPLLHAFPNILAVADSPAVVTAMLVAGVALSVLFAAGRVDRAAAVLLWYIWACLFGRNPLISNPGLPYVGWMLLAHAFLPRAPFGSWTARGRVDPGGFWKMTPAIFGVAWIIMAAGYSFSGATKLVSPSWLDGTALARIFDNPLARPSVFRDAVLAMPPIFLKLATWGALGLELLFAPLALSRRLRPWIWGLMLAMHLGLIVFIDFADLSLGMVMLHLFTFDPAWIAPRRAAGLDTIFYDGSCGLCHRSIRFVLAEDVCGDLFRFAPLDSEAFRGAIPEERRKELPDSIVLLTAEGGILSRSSAVVAVLARAGGAWRVLAGLLWVIPRPLRDLGYELVARVRYRLFGRAAQSCPILPSYLAARFSG